MLGTDRKGINTPLRLLFYQCPLFSFWLREISYKHMLFFQQRIDGVKSQSVQKLNDMRIFRRSFIKGGIAVTVDVYRSLFFVQNGFRPSHAAADTAHSFDKAA